MVRENYKWNISKEKASNVVFNTIQTILNEKQNHSIDLDELVLLIQNRNKDLNILNNNKSKNIVNYIKNVFGGIVQFIDTYDDFLLIEGKDKIIIKLNDIELDLNEWIFVKET
jgi:hypothetical protein